MDAVASIGEENPPWADILHASRDLVGADSGSLIMFDGEGDLLHVAQVGLAQDTVTAYSTHYHRLDMLAHVAMRQDAGNWLDSDEALPRQALLRSEFYSDYLAPHRQAQILALMIERNERGLCAMSFQRSSVEQGARQRLASGEAGIFVGAFQQALAARQRDQTTALHALDNTFGAMGEGVCLVNAQGMVAHQSASCAGLLDDRQGLHVRHGHLHHRNAMIRCYLLRQIESTLCTGERTKCIVKLGWGEALALDITRASRQWTLVGSPLALVRMTHKTVDTAVDTDALMSAFSLTPAEARVLAGLAAGHSPTEYAETNGVAESTVRKQVATLKDKLDCRRTVDLVRLALLAQR
ncbi:helix-turn-helix transcriptional regulator [Cupriavidus pauculus]|uniref:helix-turn-helix transcriptional regulator n=1 Tax=Cupriavidus pauculus TaxID=82633 RepID=UPI001EE2B5EE|nr:helix-turn-helix transcriptional regulator [Cupriavidus pauculus]